MLEEDLKSTCVCRSLNADAQNHAFDSGPSLVPFRSFFIPLRRGETRKKNGVRSSLRQFKPLDFSSSFARPLITFLVYVNVYFLILDLNVCFHMRILPEPRSAPMQFQQFAPEFPAQALSHFRSKNDLVRKF